ncbi:MAG: PQQ-binding-like beta-propeller repeat protein [Deltaproteobacteria bacterium]|nr:PQQ-binding-like beta-propeller repeat protein [Deltaproteobacteria bacterium]
MSPGTDPDGECAPGVCDGLGGCVKGSHLWSTRLGDSDMQMGSDVAVDGVDNVLVAGWLSGTADLGGGPLESAGSWDVFVAKYDKDGKHLWGKRFGDASKQMGDAVAVDAGGDVVVAGHFEGSVDFGGGPLTSVGGYDLFVVKLDPNGKHLWSKRFGAAGYEQAPQIRVDGAGAVLLTGFFEGTVDFGGGPLVSAGYADIFVAKLDKDGKHLWSKGFGADGQDTGDGIAVDGTGSALVTGACQGTVDFGGGPLPGAGGDDVFVAKFDKDGKHVWSKRAGNGQNQRGLALALDAFGSSVVTGWFFGAIDFGGGLLVSAGGYDIFVAKLDKDGKHVWSKRFGDGSEQFGFGIAVDGAGSVVLTGQFVGTVDFGGGPLASAGAEDIFVAKLHKDGKHLWSKRFGDVKFQSSRSIAADASGNALVTGAFGGTVDFGGGLLVSAGGHDVFLVKFGP